MLKKMSEFRDTSQKMQNISTGAVSQLLAQYREKAPVSVERKNPHPANSGGRTDAQDDELSKLLDGGVEQHTDAIELSDRQLSSKNCASRTKKHPGRTRSAQERKETSEGAAEGTA